MIKSDIAKLYQKSRQLFSDDFKLLLYEQLSSGIFQSDFSSPKEKPGHLLLLANVNPICIDFWGGH